jgi:hypothetical protein
LQQVIDALSVKTAGSSLDSMNFVSLSQKELGEIGAVLAGYAGDKSSLGTIQYGGSHVVTSSQLESFSRRDCPYAKELAQNLHMPLSANETGPP